MNDRDLLREFRADLPAPDLARGRARLTAAMRPRPVRRVLLPVGAVATAGALALVGITLAGSSQPAPVATSAQPDAAARLLGDASAVVAAEPNIEPAPGQWIYTTSISSGYGQSKVTDPEWITFDGADSAYLQDGKLIRHHGTDTPGTATYAQAATPKTSYEAMAALPTDPKALLAYVDQQIAGQGWVSIEGSSPLGLYAAKDSQPQREFDYLTGLLWQSQRAAPSSAIAAVFRALSTLPGITTQAGVPDDNGNPTVAISANGGLTRMLLDPTTYRVRGAQSLSTGTDPVKKPNRKPAEPWPARGQLLGSITLAQIALVAGPGLTA